MSNRRWRLQRSWSRLLLTARGASAIRYWKGISFSSEIENHISFLSIFFLSLEGDHYLVRQPQEYEMMISLFGYARSISRLKMTSGSSISRKKGRRESLAISKQPGKTLSYCLLLLFLVHIDLVFYCRVVQYSRNETRDRQFYLHD